MFYVYALKSVKHNRIFIGSTENLEKRIKEHNSGVTKSTKFYKPWQIFYFEQYLTRKEAESRELKLKTGSGREFVKNKLNAPVAHKDRAAVS